MTKDEFATELYALMLSKGKEPSKDMAKAWYNDLKELPDDKVKAAFQKLRRSPGGFPNVGEIYEMINPPLDKDAEAERAWVRVVNCEGYSNNKFIRSVVQQIGGPDTIGYADYTYQLPRAKKRFITLYKDMIKSTPEYVKLPVPVIKKALPAPEPKPLPCTPEQAEKNKAKIAEILSDVGEKRL